MKERRRPRHDAVTVTSEDGVGGGVDEEGAEGSVAGGDGFAGKGDAFP